MAKLKVSELTKTANVSATDLVYVVQGATSKAANLHTILNSSFAKAGPPGTSVTWIVSSNTIPDSYVFRGPGFTSMGSKNPGLTVYRGLTYTITNNDGYDYPMSIKETANGSLFSSSLLSSVINDGIQTITITVPMEGISSLYYQSNISPGMGNVIYIR